MRRAHISSVKPGDKLGRAIFQENGNVLLGDGVELTQRFIDRLTNMGIDMVYIEDPFTEDLEPSNAISDETRKKAISTVHKTMTSLMDAPTTRGRAIAPEMGRTFRNVFGQLLNDLAAREELLVSLTNIQATDAYLFNHSVNVAILAGIMGVAKGYNRNQLEELGVGALLFDIGMTQMPKELLGKTSPITQEERAVIEKHAEDGFNLLRSQHDISLLSAHCAFQHHERFDGSGYPRKIKGSEIHEYAQIVAIADVYDALTSPRPHRRRYTPTEAIEFLFAAGGTFFDVNLIKMFCQHISIYPIATTVLLSTGQIAVVCRNNMLAVHRPTVRILREPDGNPPAAPYEIELKDTHNLMIVKEV
ncbi:HD-GYP domain-containing protein (c-di-GMP phosphodiesterase class II) [Paenibacillus phyllosphaerae]|uniref:HD-GYP domain-containing protein (C-di-GMP phosphodiesterase class II) n=1 Tax=Paenibacillus phyllosphaerae TaxID=274593 RepID=A0A7W5ATK1_9BACL|nr:HD-GYP domain-containing protein [Paenibacillus phyllosphaerae]MBB3108515.1 HD-GYP domain-containing protein (c-di-GMP phosphodiesterase class II) [Paenibacillus phyllosphaerae]